MIGSLDRPSAAARTSTPRRLLLPVLISAVLMAGPAWAQTQPPAAAPQQKHKSQGLNLNAFLSDDETQMLLDYMHDAFDAAMKGEEAPPMPPELAFKLAIIQQRVLIQGNAAVEEFMLMLQKELDKAIKQMQKQHPPPSTAPDHAGN